MQVGGVFVGTSEILRFTCFQSGTDGAKLITRIWTIAILFGPVETIGVNIVDPDYIDWFFGLKIEHGSWGRASDFSIFTASKPGSCQSAVIEPSRRVIGGIFTPCLNVDNIDVLLNVNLSILRDFCVSDQIDVLLEVFL